MPDDTPNTIGTSFTVAAMMNTPEGEAPELAPSARQCDYLFCHWQVVNLTGGVLDLTFRRGRYFTLRLLRADQSAFWAFPDPAPGDDDHVRLENEGEFGLPPDEMEDEDDVLPAKLPRVDLKAILTQQQIPDTESVYLEFQPMCEEFYELVRIRLW